MKVRALQTVYNRSEGKEYQKGQEFDATDREARVMIKLRRAEAVEREKSAPKPEARPQRQVRPAAPAAAPTFETSAMKAEESPARQEPIQTYRRRDMRPQE